MNSLFSTIFLLTVQVTSLALDLTAETKLRKLSYLVRGFPPSQKEFEELAKVKISDPSTETFLKQKLNEYTSSPWAAAKLSEKIFEDWRLENDFNYLNPSLPNIGKQDAEIPYPIMASNEKSIIRHIQKALIKGQTWDQILVMNSFVRSLDVEVVVQTFKEYYFNYGFNTKIQNFKKDSLAKGLKLETPVDIQTAIEEFEKIPASNVNSNVYSPSPYLRNSKIDPKLTILIIQGALDNNSSKLDELIAHIEQIPKDLTTYKNEILSLTSATKISDSDKLPQLIFSLNEMTARYKKTIYSKAAAFFRIYLCDDMSPVVLPGKNSKSQEALKIIHGPSEQPMSLPPPPPPAQGTKDEHLRPECSGCHDKLNPMETNFNKKFKRFSGNDNKPSSFNFVYEDFTGKDIRITISDIEQLPEILLKQPQYIRCQSEKFWNWYVGTDVPLNPNQRKELEKVYVATQSKPSELIKYLVSLKPFSSNSFLNEPKQFNNVRPIMQKCHSCHKTDPTIPSLLEIPFNLNKNTTAEKMAEHFEVMQNIVKLTNILESQTKIRMPPKEAGWKLTENEKATLVRWIFDGAKDETGADTLTTEQKTKLLMPTRGETIDAVKRNPKVEPTLRSTWQRILNYTDILRTLTSKLGNTSVCFQRMVSSKLALGHIDIYTGTPISDQPDNAFRETYRTCLVQLLKSKEQSFIYGPISKEELELTGLKQMLQEMASALPAETPEKLFGRLKWKDLGSEQKMKMIQAQINFILGPNLNHVESETDLNKKTLAAVDQIMTKKNADSIVSAAFYSLYYILNSDSFFIY